ncbi:sensor domain-containing protein [Streptosporangium sp. NBC_01755]|uniref:sensor domain-containing protein n=1 Tax=unclassified Streptosporangium TaxID=2632669 RepID=UPI002DDA4FAB|nr:MULTISPECIES: sensor domain-containing protein [unclassified Streptosporangium]WSA25034.1 sensor domain-containing protein [Streptosporangium sp. NBC_01810]WSD03635.1 sensor domain-containing protein [Streptosporangium sp. NBC_01755]
MSGIEATTPWARISAHWSAWTWLRTAHLVTGLPIALLGAAAIVGLTVASVLFVWTVVVPVVALLLCFWVVRLLTRVQRSRFAAFLDVDIPSVPHRPLSRNPFRRLLQEARTRSTWRRLSYHLLAPLISGVGAASNGTCTTAPSSGWCRWR